MSNKDSPPNANTIASHTMFYKEMKMGWVTQGHSLGKMVERWCLNRVLKKVRKPGSF